MVAKDSTLDHSKLSPMDLTHHFSRSSKKRVANVIKEYYRFSSIPGMGSLAGGLPYYGYFPFTQLDVRVTASHGPSRVDQDSCVTSDNTIALRINQIQDEADMFRRVDLATALQYGTAQGFPPLYSWIRNWTNSVYHSAIPYQGKADVVICGGSADGLSKIYDLLFNEWDSTVNRLQDREGLLVEEMVYIPPIAQTKHKDVNIVPVKMDAEGMIVDGSGGLLDVLESWNEADGKRPHALYLIPNGQNPTSGVLSIQRRNRIYEICSQFDVLIIEDDPYWNLQYPSAQTQPLTANNPPKTSQNHGPAKDTTRVSTGYDFLNQLVPSFLSLDVDGRVIRLDTFSKTIAPGCRLGWITAQPRICEQLIRLTDATSQQPSGITQAVVAQLLSDFGRSESADPAVDAAPPTKVNWGMDGWVRWLEHLRDSYQKRMVTMATIFQDGRHVQTHSGPVEMFSFNWPMGGMFVWMKINLEQHPLGHCVDTERLMQALWILCTQEPYRVLMNPGKDFAANDAIRSERAHLYLRFCFGTVEESVLVSKSHCFIDACRQFWGFSDVKDIDQILIDEDNRRAAQFDEVERLPVVNN